MLRSLITMTKPVGTFTVSGLAIAVFFCGFAGVASAEVPLVDENGVVVGVQDIIGDVNEDCTVNFLDIGPFVQCLRTGDYHPQADLDFSGAVDFGDILPFLLVLTG